MFVLGTAGHIDHGKSTLIRAMTGIDPDRLPEEKERGMTIDLGFAWLSLPDGEEIGLVDVPGHERFVRNMVAGAGGINAAMLVVAADDGWMPQTQEHFDILNLLDIEYGLVAVTKTDLVEPDWLELVISDIKSKIKGSFLEKGPVLPVSSETGEGVEDVVRAISDIASKLKEVEDIGKPRLFVDRAFVLTGIGVVVTGTSRGGGFTADSDVYRFPGADRIKVRSLQAHARKVERVAPGSRVAINLSGVDRSEIKRGNVITGFAYPEQPEFFAVWLRNLDNSGLTIKEGRKVLVIHGTTETEAIVRPFDNDGIPPGRQGLAIIKTAEPLAAFIPDNFILRLPTPQVTIGGGKILDILDHYPRRKDLPKMQDYLEQRNTGGLKELVLTELDKKLFSSKDNFLKYSNFSQDNIESEIDRLIEKKEIVKFDNSIGLKKKISALAEVISGELQKTHQKKSYLKGLTAEKLLRSVNLKNQESLNFLLRYLEAESVLDRTNQYYYLPDFKPVLDNKMKDEAERILKEVAQAGHNYLSYDDVEKKYPGSRRTVNFLTDEGRLMAVGSQFLMIEKIWKEIVEFIGRQLDENQKVTVAEFRDRFGSSRKYALPVLEYLDQVGLTRREGDYRVKGAHFDERHLL